MFSSPSVDPVQGAASALGKSVKLISPRSGLVKEDDILEISTLCDGFNGGRSFFFRFASSADLEDLMKRLGSLVQEAVMNGRPPISAIERHRLFLQGLYLTPLVRGIVALLIFTSVCRVR